MWQMPGNNVLNQVLMYLHAKQMLEVKNVCTRGFTYVQQRLEKELRVMYSKGLGKSLRLHQVIIWSSAAAMHEPIHAECSNIYFGVISTDLDNLCQFNIHCIIGT